MIQIHRDIYLIYISMYRSQRDRIDDIHALFFILIFVDVEVTGRVLRAAAPNFHAPTLLQKKKNKRNVDR